MHRGHPIQVVVQRTGLSADVIRIWERRYGVVKPSRIEGARRMYSDADIERLKLLRNAVSGGFRISDVAALSNDAIAEIIKPNAPVPESDTTEAEYLETCLQAVIQLDQPALRQRLLEAEAALSLLQLLEGVVTSLLERIGAMWESGKLRIGHEHMASVEIQAFLASILSTSNMTENGPLLLAATPVGQNHGLGLLMAAIMAASDGWKVLLLGTNIPAAEIAAACRQSKAAAIVLSLNYPPDDPRVPVELQKLHDLVSDAVPIFAGGKAAPAYGVDLEAIHAQIPTTLGDFRTALRRIRS